MAKNKVIAGDYEGKDVVGTGTACILLGWTKSLDLNKDIIESYEVVTEEHTKGKGIYLVSIKFKDGKESLLEIDGKIYRLIVKDCFVTKAQEESLNQMNQNAEAGQNTEIYTDESKKKKSKFGIVVTCCIIVFFSVVIWGALTMGDSGKIGDNRTPEHFVQAFKDAGYEVRDVKVTDTTHFLAPWAPISWLEFNIMLEAEKILITVYQFDNEDARNEHYYRWSNIRELGKNGLFSISMFPFRTEINEFFMAIEMFTLMAYVNEEMRIEDNRTVEYFIQAFEDAGYELIDLELLGPRADVGRVDRAVFYVMRGRSDENFVFIEQFENEEALNREYRGWRQRDNPNVEKNGLFLMRSNPFWSELNEFFVAIE